MKGATNMAKKVTVSLVDDIDKSTPADETVSFALDGVNYEIDLSSGNAAALRDALAVYIANGERKSGRKSTRSAGSASPAQRGKVSRIRAWARDHGHDVSDRGRISAEVQAAYEKAHA